jgi:hypothetical protein
VEHSKYLDGSDGEKKPRCHDPVTFLAAWEGYVTTEATMRFAQLCALI